MPFDHNRPDFVTDELMQKLETLQGRVGVYYACPARQESWGYQADMPVVAASVIKLTVMAEAFRQFESGETDPNQLITIRRSMHLPSCGALTYLHDGLQVTMLDLVTLMIILSDNTATNLLIDRLGEEKINRMIEQCGLHNTRLNRKLFMPELSAQGIENYISAADAGHFLEMILDGQLVSEKASVKMLQILSNQRLNGKLPFYLHAHGIRMAHKTGEDTGITHDVGIILTEPAQILCVVSEKTDVAETERFMQDLAASCAGV